MHPELPQPLKNYVHASNRNDVHAFTDCFAEDAVIFDEDETRKGREAIAKWFLDTKAKYQQQVEPLEIKEHGDRWSLTARITGKFDGSPIELEYHLVIRDGLIRELSIQ